MKKRLQFSEIEYEVFGACDGSVIKPIWEKFGNSHFSNPSYLACAISHLSIYQDAIQKGYDKILILEDDVRCHYKVNQLMDGLGSEIPQDFELLYLGFIPLTDDCSRWDYNVFGDRFITENMFHAKNLWGLFSYGISSNLMKEILDTYSKTFPMELDRYFVTQIQKRGNSYGLLPQLFATEDGWSDNSKKMEVGLLQKSIDLRFSNLTDYI